MHGIGRPRRKVALTSHVCRSLCLRTARGPSCAAGTALGAGRGADRPGSRPAGQSITTVEGTTDGPAAEHPVFAPSNLLFVFLLRL